MSTKCLESATYLSKVEKTYEGNKQVCGIVALADLYKHDDIYDKLSRNLPYGMSTF